MASACHFGPLFLQAVTSQGYTAPTPVQMQAVPVLAARRSAIVLAETGSGKSLAFIAPLLELVKRGEGLSAIVIAPTRELTIQLYKEFLMFQESRLQSSPRVRFLRKALMPTNEDALKKFLKTTEILVASPLKAAQLTEKFPSIPNVKFLVIDEADKMFELGFLEQVD